MRNTEDPVLFAGAQPDELIDLGEVLEITGENRQQLLAGVQIKKWPKPLKEWELVAVSRRGRKRYRYRPRWSRLAIESAYLQMRVQAAHVQGRK